MVMAAALPVVATAVAMTATAAATVAVVTVEAAAVTAPVVVTAATAAAVVAMTTVAVAATVTAAVVTVAAAVTPYNGSSGDSGVPGDSAGGGGGGDGAGLSSVATGSTILVAATYDPASLRRKDKSPSKRCSPSAFNVTWCIGMTACNEKKLTCNPGTYATSKGLS